MFARLTAKIVLAAVAVALAFFGIGLLGMALAAALAGWLGTPGAEALAGAIFLVPPLIWALVTHFTRPRRAAPPAGGVAQSFLGAIARQSPWAAVAGAALTGVVEMFLNRNKPPK
jgi:hypothetical protein